VEGLLSAGPLRPDGGGGWWRPFAWVAVAASSFGLAAWLLSLGDEPAPPAAPAVAFPDRLRPPEAQRAVARRRLPAPAAPAATARPRDPLLAALPPGGSAIVLEANALRNSPVGELLLSCFTANDPRLFDQFRQEVGVDLLQGLDRIALSDRAVEATGQFGGARWSALAKGDPGQGYGDDGVLYRIAGDGGSPMTMARWGDQLLAFTPSPESARQVIDRVEGRGDDGPPVLSEGQTYGDAYGVLTGAWLSGLVKTMLSGPGQAPLEDRLLSAANSVELHLDAQSDLELTATFTGPDAAAVDDLGRAVGGALSLWRLGAAAKGNAKLSALLEQAKVVPKEGSFTLDLAMPLSLVRELLGSCGKKP